MTTVRGKPKGEFRMGHGFVDTMRQLVESELDQLREQCRDVLDGPFGEVVSRLIQTAQNYPAGAAASGGTSLTAIHMISATRS
jgi:hypothetical protein